MRQPHRNGLRSRIGRQVFLVSDNWWNIENHANVRKFRRLEDAITALMAMQKGEQVRNEVERERQRQITVGAPPPARGPCV